MSVPALSAARTLCEARDWTISNLELQKLLYIAEMYRLGLNVASLINEDFEAWDYGPVVPEVYSRAKGFGKGPVPNVFHWVHPVERDTDDWVFLRDLAKQTRKFTAGQLVNITHWPKGAWATHYRPGIHGIKIPKLDILKEYRDREAARRA